MSVAALEEIWLSDKKEERFEKKEEEKNDAQVQGKRRAEFKGEHRGSATCLHLIGPRVLRMHLPDFQG